jgi:hypothetical protein
MDGAEERLMKFAAPRLGRVLWPSGAIIAAFLVVSAIVQLNREEAGWSVWLQLIFNTFWGVAFAWMSYLTFCVPAVRIDAGTVSWRTCVRNKFQLLKVQDLVGYRLQDTFDLRLQLKSGEERSIHLSQVAKRDRGPLVAAIAKLVHERTAAI